MNLLLQDTPVGYTDLYWISGAVIVLIICYFYWIKFGRAQNRREEQNKDLRSHIINETNYNIHRDGIDGHRTATRSGKEADNLVDNLKKTDTLPTSQEFHELRDDLRKS